MREIRGRLLRWYRRNRRDLPWRRTSDPYAIWVCEVMLQQTRVAVVIPYYERFLARFPDVATLARASEDEVLASWSGLGYYRRARSLHLGARAVLANHAGRVPEDAECLRALPGIGRYTAGAIASVAFGRPEPILDGNVRRVLARLLGRARPRDSELWELARSLVRGASPGDFNQALMELGATVCTPEGPRCEVCPVATSCVALARGRTEQVPAPKKRLPAERARVVVAVVEVEDRILLERRDRQNPLRGTWELPAIEIGARENARDAIEKHLAQRHALVVRAGAEYVRVSHAILNRRLTLEVHACRLLRGRLDGEQLRVVAPGAIDGVAVSGATKKVLRVQRPGRAVTEIGSSHSSASSIRYASSSGSGSGSRARSRR